MVAVPPPTALRGEGFSNQTETRMRKPAAPAIATQLKHSARFEAEKTLQQHRYCDAFELWRSCRFKRCLHNRRCCGDVNACLAKAVALDRISHRVQWRTRQDILEATPQNIGAPERAARQCMPLDFYLQRGKS
jgi:hypothetical protein